MDIRLVDHVGYTPRGRRVEHNQWLVQLDGQHVGFLGKRPGSHLSLVAWADPDTRAEIEQAISQQLGRPIGGSAMINEPQDEPPADEDDDEDINDLDFENEDF